MTTYYAMFVTLMRLPSITLSGGKLHRLCVYCVMSIMLLGSARHAGADTFQNASNANLQRICSNNNNLGPDLESFCGQLGGAAINSSTGVGTQSQASSVLISQQQQKDSQTKLDNKLIPKGSATSYSAFWDNYSVFFTTGASSIHHRNNDFEQGYNASAPAVLLGGSYRINPRLKAGLALNYTNTSASNNSGGGFDLNAYGPLLFVSYIPFANAFADLSFSYTRQDQTNTRNIVLNTASANIPQFAVSTRGKLNTNQYGLNFLSGYDYVLENFSIGPRAGLNIRNWDTNSYRETSHTGLELSFNSQSQISVLTTLGIGASALYRMESFTLVPQLGVSWVHEYANNSRSIHAQFVQAIGSGDTGFNFNTEQPARNYAVIDCGISIWLKQDLQLYASLSTVQGNRNFENYAGNLGVQMLW
jgi:uncharacterized protein YhjY with autotransporter beta-barrel domain